MCFQIVSFLRSVKFNNVFFSLLGSMELWQILNILQQCSNVHQAAQWVTVSDVQYGKKRTRKEILNEHCFKNYIKILRCRNLYFPFHNIISRNKYILFITLCFIVVFGFRHRFQEAIPQFQEKRFTLLNFRERFVNLNIHESNSHIIKN